VTSVAADPATVAAFDAVVIVTDQTGVDWQALATHARLIVDTRGVLRRHGITEGVVAA
jgi:UDP-N-acetyl-D-glucosamine dehydrogenase